jgi:hypothetical protein
MVHTETVAVPRIAVSQTCFAHMADVSGACWDKPITLIEGYPTTGSVTSLAWRDRDFSNLDHQYPPWYYRFMYLIATPFPAQSVMIIRAANVFLVLGILFATILLSRRSMRQALVGTAITASVPLGIFITASVNPSAWALISVTTVWAALVGAVEEQSRKRKLALLAIAALAAFMALAARIDAAAYVAIALICVPLCSPTAFKLVKRFWVFGVVAVGVAGVLGFALRSSTTQWGMVAPRRITANHDALVLLFQNTTEISQMWTGAMGGWGLGQIDVLLPSIVPALVVPVFLFLVLTGIKATPKGKWAALAVSLGVIIAFPLITLQARMLHIGEMVQPRYMLPMIFLFGAIAILQSVRSGGIRLGSGQRYVLTGMLAIAQAVALHFTIRRYVSGTDVIDWNLNVVVEWWPSYLLSPMTTWMIVTIAFVILAHQALRVFAPLADE